MTILVGWGGVGWGGVGWGGVGWGGVGWGGVKDLYQDAFLLYFILWLFIALSKAFITSFMLAVVLNNKVVISLH